MDIGVDGYPLERGGTRARVKSYNKLAEPGKTAEDASICVEADQAGMRKVGPMLDLFDAPFALLGEGEGVTLLQLACETGEVRVLGLRPVRVLQQ
jgi:hypothetical protein